VTKSQNTTDADVNNIIRRGVRRLKPNTMMIVAIREIAGGPDKMGTLVQGTAAYCGSCSDLGTLMR